MCGLPCRSSKAVMSLGFFSSVLTSVLVLINHLRETIYAFHHNSVIDLCCPLSTSKIFLINESYWVVSIDFLLFLLPTSSACSEFILPTLRRQHTLTRIIAICAERKSTPIQGLSPIFLQSELSRIVFHLGVQPIGDIESQCCGLLAFGILRRICGHSSSER